MKQTEKNSVLSVSDYQSTLDHTLKSLSIPKNYELKNVQNKKQNNSNVLIFRFEKSDGQNNRLNGEHYSITVDKDTEKILGFTWMDKSLSEGSLPSPRQTKEVSKDFLNKIEPGLFNKLENLWIKPHEEIIFDENGKEIKVIGMKYKCYKKDDDTYAWVIVGPHNQIITFEQEIIWNGGRVTEKWLHDTWLLENGSEQ
ncbi:YcdB/YcdC domain-containing protein [Priestia aryabhattai]|uniref:YcdB/YcdC domain-containing protein n=1 Tax=Priestia megaterium TaxID=1404 RepID=UPI0039B9CC6E